MSYGKNMMLVTTYWGQDKTFKLMPVTDDCPYMECIYDIHTDMLVVITKVKAEKLQMVPKLDDNGNQIQSTKPKANNKPWKEKQVQLNVPNEFYFTEREEQVEFMKNFAVNFEEYDFQKYFDMRDEAMNQKFMTPEQMPILDENGIAAEQKKGTVKSMVPETPATDK